MTRDVEAGVGEVSGRTRWLLLGGVAAGAIAGSLLSRAAPWPAGSAGGPSRRDPAAVVWLTGLSGSGKSTIATLVVNELDQRGLPVESLDGDAIREVFPATGFTKPERDAHVRRVGFLASRLERHGVYVVASLVSPYAESRDFVRRLCRNFIEVYVDTPIEECERRDVKGLYARARRGEIRNFTGLDDPYEPPAAAEIVLVTSRMSAAEGAARVLAEIDRRTRRS